MERKEFKRILTSRQSALLAAVVESYTKMCTPVGSELIARQKLPDYSPATIRNDMADLEAAGLLSHPHTSAGRVPTSAGYRYYVDHNLGEYRLTTAERRALQVEDAGEPRLQVKAVAKRLAELSSSCAVVGFSTRDVYYTGIANLFAQPEFHDYQFSFSMSEVLDHLDVVMASLYQPVTAADEVRVLIGDGNPFGVNCGALVVRFGSPRAAGVIGLLGPLRMNYPRNRALLNSARLAIIS